MKLNKQQEVVAEHVDGNLVVFAGAGSGKSTVLVNKIDRMIKKGINPNEILLITFTRNSAEDLQKKLNKLGIVGVECGTFHSTCSRILFKHGIDTSHTIQEWKVENAFKKMNNNEKVDIEDVLGFISYQKNNMISYTDKFLPKESAYSDIELRNFYCEYEKLKASEKAYDFDDYLLECFKLYEDGMCLSTWKYLLIDENQDNNLLQNKLMHHMCPYGNIVLVGDEKQSLYQFRGANPNLFKNAPNVLIDAEVVHLDTNYRSAQNIVNCANHFARKYFGGNEYYSDAIANRTELGSVTTLTSVSKDEEALQVVSEIKKLLAAGEPPEQIAVLYRNNNQSAHIEMMLREHEIPYDIQNNGSFFKKKEIDAVMCVLRLIIDPSDDAAMEQLFTYRICSLKYISKNLIAEIRGLASRMNINFISACEIVPVEKAWQRNALMELPTLIDKLSRQERMNISTYRIIENIIQGLDLVNYIEENYQNEEERENRLESLDSLLEFVTGGISIAKFLKYAYETSVQQKKKKRSNPNAIKLMTVHGSKGLEWNNVFVVGLTNGGKFPSVKADIDDEVCVGYVAFTRAKDKLYVSGEDGNIFFEDYKEAIEYIN